MSIAVTVALWALRIVGILLLAILLLVLLVCLIPLGVAVQYRDKALRADACLGPVRIAVWPRPAPKPRRAKARPTSKKTKKTPKKQAPEQPPKADAAPLSAPPSGSGPAATETAPPPAEAKTSPAPAAAPAKAADSEKPAAPDRVQVLLDLLREDPFDFIGRVLDHLAFAGGRLLHGIHVSGLRVYWTVTGADAAATAIQYGRLMALCNNLLVRARKLMDIRAEELWLEPDYTGEQAEKRAFACKVTLRPIIIVILAPRLLLRLWRDESIRSVLRPKPPKPNP